MDRYVYHYNMVITIVSSGEQSSSKEENYSPEEIRVSIMFTMYKYTTDARPKGSVSRGRRHSSDKSPTHTNHAR
jgi:hypothetical protein